MKFAKLLVSLVAVFALAILSVASVSAFGYIQDLEVSGVSVYGDQLAISAGQTIPVKVVFYAWDNATDVRVKAWISGERENAASTDRFDVIEGRAYIKTLAVQLPSKVDPDEEFELEVVVESRNDGIADGDSVKLTVQRESYAIEILDVLMDSEVKAGSNLALDLILKNVGRQLAEDTFVKVTIPALGVEKKAYFGDLSAVDQSNPDKEDAAERRMTLSIPSNAPTGVYLVELEAYNADSTAKMTKKLAITGGAIGSTVFVSTSTSKTFAVGEVGEYSLTLVNSGDNIRVYELVPETSSALNVNVAEPIVAVPAGTSRTVKVEAVASQEGKNSFAVNVYSDGELVKKYSFLANNNAAEGKGFVGSATVLTVVLAIIFVVLLVVLIVLLTRKPEKTEEFGESYY
ncbi:MAG: hypothetical protein QXD13_00650 [Candidatus Pacearchaeota archaeon]